jgi:hypothetical protein
LAQYATSQQEGMGRIFCNCATETVEVSQSRRMRIKYPAKLLETSKIAEDDKFFAADGP